ncbi:tetratricopeptide repeat protein [Micromonospora sp. DT41]|uniref:fibronectin type III domain-containing protein n=1 Tax=Micromonospora TaxID=1873 RepID=UPI003CE75C96
MSHPSPLAAVQRRALALRTAGDLISARQLLAEVVESARPPYGTDHPEMLHTAHLLARLHRESDDPLAARRVLEEAFAAGERRWDHGEPTMLALALELAEVAEELGNRHEARRNYTRVATAGPAVLGEHHPAVRAARHYLGAASPSTGGPAHPVSAPPSPDPVRPHVTPPTPTSAPTPTTTPTYTPAPASVVDSGARTALSGPTLSLATLAAMRPAADGSPPPTSAWAPVPPTPPQDPPTVRTPAAPAPPTVSEDQPAPASSARPAPPESDTRPAPTAAAPVPPPRTPSTPAVPSPPPTPTLSPATSNPAASAVAVPPSPTHPAPPRQRSAQQQLPPATPPAEDQPQQQPTAVPPRQRSGNQPTHPDAETPTARLPAAPPPPPPPPVTPRWDNPTIQVRQIEPLLAEEAARVAASRSGGSGSAVGSSGPDPAGSGSAVSSAMDGSAVSQAVPAMPPRPVSAPAADSRSVSSPPDHTNPTSAPPAHARPVSGPPGHAYPVSGPPGHQPVSTPPGYTHPTSGPPGHTHLVSGPPVSAQPWGLGASAWNSSAPPQPTPVSAPPAADPDATVVRGEITSGARHQDRYGPEPGSASAPTEVFPTVQPATGAGALSPHPVPSPRREAATPAWAPRSDAGPTSDQQAHQRGYAHQPYPPAPAPHAVPGQYPTRQPYPGEQYHQGQRYSQPYAQDGGTWGRHRGALIAAAVAVGVAAVGLGVVLLNRDDAPPPSGAATTTAAPTAAGPAPGDLKLRDDSATITLTWTDPSGGAVPFMVAGGRTGQALGVLATVDPGRTSYTVSGLRSRVDYCFTVLAVYSTDSFATSGQVCTERDRSTPPT